MSNPTEIPIPEMRTATLTPNEWEIVRIACDAGVRHSGLEIAFPLVPILQKLQAQLQPQPK